MSDIFIVGLILIFMFLVGFGSGASVKKESELESLAKQVLEKCQKDLPRSQVCELTAKLKEAQK